MAVGTVSSVINSSFVAQFSGAKNTSSAASGDLQFTSSDQVSTTLSAGTRTLTAAYQGLGQVIGFVNGSLATLKSLGKIAENVVRVAESASRTTSAAQRTLLSAEYQRLGDEFNKLVDAAKIKDLDLLNEGDIAQVLTNVGLSPDKASSIAQALSRVITPTSDKSLADSHVKDLRPVRVPDEEIPIPGGGGSTEIVPGTPPKRYNDVFDPTRTIRTRGDAMVLANDAKKLLSNIKTNLSALTDVQTGIANNMDLVRATALAFRAESKDPASLNIKSAQSLAAQIQGLITQNANPRSFREAGNLNSIVSAALLYA